jgi:amidase
VGRDPGKLRIAFTATPPSGAKVDPQCVAAVQDAAQLCADLGHTVEEARAGFGLRAVPGGGGDRLSTPTAAMLAQAPKCWGAR